jgi:hypothetical protein
VDHYNSVAAYVQRDPQPHAVPGVFGIYQIAHDSNPGLDANGLQLPPASSKAMTLELYESLFNKGAVIGVRDEFTDDGLGTLAHYQNVDVAFNVPNMRYLHGYVEAGLGANSTAPNAGPAWRWLLWWTTPIGQP